MWCTRGKARESWDTYTTVDFFVRRKAFLLWEVATDSSASTCLLPRYQWYQCQDSTPPVKMAESDVLGKALGFMSFMLKTKFCAHSHGWHQWSGTLVAAMRSIFYLSDRGWRNQWISRTERGLSTINLETLKMCRKPLNHTRFDQKSRETGAAHGFNVKNEDNFWKLTGNSCGRLDRLWSYRHIHYGRQARLTKSLWSGWCWHTHFPSNLRRFTCRSPCWH